MLTHIVVGYRFHSVQLAEALSRIGENFSIFSSVPKKRFGSFPTHFVPMLASVGRKLTGIRFDRFGESECAWFDRLSWLRMKSPDVLYGWAGYSLFCGTETKKRGGTYVLERSCPHIDYQEELIERESAYLGIEYKKKSSWWRERCLAEYQQADRIVVPSIYSYQSFLKMGIHKQKLYVAPLDHPRMAPRKRQTRKQKEVIVGVLGGNPVRKGYVHLFQAWDRLKPKNAKLIVKAEKKELESYPVLKELISKCPSIEFRGYYPDISDFYSECDLFCLPSIDDGFGLAMLEAICHSLPVIVTENVGAADLLRSSKAGYVVPPFSSDVFVEVLGELIDDRFKREEMSTAAYALANQLSCSSVYYDRIRALYSQHLLPLCQERSKVQSRRLLSESEAFLDS